MKNENFSSVEIREGSWDFVKRAEKEKYLWLMKCGRVKNVKWCVGVFGDLNFGI